MRDKWNILFIDHGGKLFGGGHLSTLLLIGSLNRDLFDVYVVSARENPFTERARELGCQTAILPVSEKLTSVYRDRVTYSPLFVLERSWQMVAGIAQLCRYVRHHDIHLIHPCDNLSRIIGGLCAKLTGRPAVCHVRDELDNRLLINRILRWIMLLTMDRIIAVSERIGGLFAKGSRMPQKLVVIHNGVDLRAFDPGTVSSSGIREQLNLSADTVLLAIIGILIPIKGHAILFEALRSLKRRGVRNVACVVVGDGPELQNLREKVMQDGLEQDVLFLGFRNDIANILRDVDIVVMPSLTEAFPRTILESMAMALPVVATRVGGIPEAVEDNVTGFLVPPDDSEAVATAVKRLIDGRQLRGEMGQNARQRAETRFDIRQNARRTADIYLELLVGKGREVVTG